MRALLIVILCVVMAVAYGIAHDQVTARLCVEYFTVFHPPVIRSSDPTLLALVWGVIATWWVGVLLGIPLAIASRAGARPKRDAASLIRPIGILLAVMACCAFVSGFVGWTLAEQGRLVLRGWSVDLIPKAKHSLFFADLFAHNASYAVGFLGGLVVIAGVWRSRLRARSEGGEAWPDGSGQAKPLRDEP